MVFHADDERESKFLFVASVHRLHRFESFGGELIEPCRLLFAGGVFGELIGHRELSCEVWVCRDEVHLLAFGGLVDGGAQGAIQGFPGIKRSFWEGFARDPGAVLEDPIQCLSKLIRCEGIE